MVIAETQIGLACIRTISSGEYYETVINGPGMKTIHFARYQDLSGAEDGHRKTVEQIEIWFGRVTTRDPREPPA